MERRCNQHRPQVRTDAQGKRTIQGYASVFYRADDPGTEYELMRYGGYRVCERIMPGAFDAALAGDDVRALFNHNPDCVLGRTRAGTCRLSVDAVGLRYEIDPPDTQTARDLLTSMDRGDVTGSSFAFDYLEKSVVERNGPNGEDEVILEVRSVKLYDVSPVTYPAYESTTASARSMDADRIKREVDALLDARSGANAKQKRARLVELGL